MAEEPSLAPVDELSKVELWSAGTGWREVPPAAVAAPRERWRVPARSDERGAFDVSDQVIVTLDRDEGTLRRIDPATGRSMWSVPMTGLVARPSVQISEDDSLVTVAGESTSAETVVLAAADGQVVWHGVTGEFVGRVESVGDLLLVGLASGTAAVDRATGVVRWQSPDVIEVYGTHLLVSDSTGQNHSLLDPATGTPLWTRTTEQFSDVHIIGDTFLVTRDVAGTAHDSMAAYDLTTGAPRWHTELDNLGRATVAPVGDGTALVTGGGGIAETAVAVVNLADGKVIWDSDGEATTVRVDGRPYVLNDHDGTTDVRDGVTGNVVSSAQLPFGRATRIAGGVLYRTGFDGVRAYRLPDLTGQWQFAAHIENGVIETPIRGGFVVTDFTDLAGHLIGYVE